MKTAIVSGANGFVGSAVVRELLQNGYEILALDQKDCFGNLPKDGRVRFVPCDLSELSCLKEIRPKAA